MSFRDRHPGCFWFSCPSFYLERILPRYLASVRVGDLGEYAQVGEGGRRRPRSEAGKNPPLSVRLADCGVFRD